MSNTHPAEPADIVERLLFLASGQDDVHSVAIAKAAAEITRLRAALSERAEAVPATLFVDGEPVDPKLPRMLLDVSGRMHCGETLHNDHKMVDAAAHALTAAFARIAAATTRAEPAQVAEAQSAVLAAAGQWWCEREINDWDEADLARAVIRLEGDWPGCPECDHQCDEPCRPATVAEMLAMVDARVAQLVHDGKLHAPEGYKPPDGWQPIKWPKSRRSPATTTAVLALVTAVNHAMSEAIDAATSIDPANPRRMPRPEGWDDGYLNGIKVCATIVQAAMHSAAQGSA